MWRESLVPEMQGFVGNKTLMMCEKSYNKDASIKIVLKLSKQYKGL